MKRVIIKYKDLSRWDVKSFLNILKSSFPVVKLWNYIYEHSEKENIFNEKEKEFPILWVTNKVWIYLNEIKKWKDINQPYKKVLAWEIAYNPYRVNVGSIWIIQEEYNNYYISPAYIVFWTKKDLYNKYLYLILSSNWFNDLLRAKTSWSVRQNLTYDLLSELEIPLPHIDIQKQIVADYENNKIKAKDFKNEAIEKEKNIDDFLMSELGIEKQEQKRKKWPFIVRYKDLNNWWSVWDYNKKVDLENKQSKNIKTIPLNKIANIKMGISPDSNFFNENWTWIPFIWWAVELKNKEIITDRYTSKPSAISKEWDIIICVRATIWKLAFWYKEYCLWRWVASITPKEVDSKYLFSLLEYFEEYLISKWTWSTFKQISKWTLENLKIPLPDIWDEKTPWTQKYIVSKIDEMKKEIDKLNIEAERLEKEADENLEKTILWV